MSDPVMDKIEQDLRAMSEESTEQTQLWKRALEVSRADERSSLVHPARSREFEPKPTRGRRLLLTLNAVGVAAMVLLAAGVWTIAVSAPSPVEDAKIAASRAAVVPLEKAEPMSDMIEMADMNAAGSAKVNERQLKDDFARDERVLAGSEEADITLDRDSAEMGTPAARSAERLMESELADASADDAADGEALGQPTDLGGEELAFTDTRTQPVVPEPGNEQPGIAQMPMGPENGLTLGLGNGTIFGPASTALPTIENAHIVLEVDDIDEAFVAVSDLPDAEQDEYSSIEYQYSEIPELEEVDVNELTLNIAPARMDETLNTIRGMGKVVEETRSQDHQFMRVNRAMDFAATQIAPQQSMLEELHMYNNMTPHERAHRQIELDETEQIAVINRAITDLSRRLQDAKRSLNLSRVRVSFKAAQDSDTIEE